jgi:sorbitol-specific phosphotransferase system component IIBC
MTDIPRFLTIILLLTISLTAYFLVINALFSKRVEKTQHVIDQMPIRAFGVGLVNFLFFGVILVVLFTITDGNANRVNSVIRIILLIPTLALTALLVVILSFGFAGMVRVLGERILPEFNILKRSIWGTVILSFACALPFVGWFILLPYIGFVGFGAVILGFFQRETVP